ncbi:MAG: hypothetical protein ACFE78_01010, partial [Candidatus Hodarchaeota archaeon]
YGFLESLALTNIILSFFLFLINLLLVLWIHNRISLNQMVYSILGIFLLSFEIFRLIIILISAIMFLWIKKIKVFRRASIITSLLIGTIFDTLFVIRFIGLACFVPAFSFISMLFVYFASVKIILFKHNDKYNKSEEERKS